MEKERQSFRSALEAVNTVNMSTEWYICLTRNRHMGLCVYSFSLCRASKLFRVLHVHHPTLRRKALSLVQRKGEVAIVESHVGQVPGLTRASVTGLPPRLGVFRTQLGLLEMPQPQRSSAPDSKSLSASETAHGLSHHCAHPPLAWLFESPEEL